jgi:predicted GH43/DUF377 family glycosyl hydrolase
MITRRKFVTSLGIAAIANAATKAWARSPAQATPAAPATPAPDQAVQAEPTPPSLETPYKYGKLILSASTDSSAFDSKSVDCPFVFTNAGRFYIAYIGYDGTGYQTGLASSNNLVDWERQGCILHRDPQSEVTRYNVAMNWILRENDVRSAGALKKIHGRYLGAYHAYPNAGYESGPAVIGLCWSKDLLHWQLDPPFLRPEDGADWERGGLYKPCLVEYEGTFYLFYNAKTETLSSAQGGGWHEQIGIATSKDLKTWTRYAGSPILRNGVKGAWDDRFASDPCVVRYSEGWAIFYYGLSSKGKARDLLAVGKDFYHPVKTDSILVDAGAPGSIDDDFAHKPSVVTHEGALYHFYCAVSGKYPNDVRGISVARSKPWT